MALERAVTMAESLDLDGTWIEFATVANKGPLINGYITAQKSELLKDIKGIFVDIGVETGFDSTIARINTIKLDFEISKGSDIDKELAFLPINGLPNGFFFKLNSLYRYDGSSIKESADTFIIELNMVVL
jgi:hypothetical protein